MNGPMIHATRLVSSEPGAALDPDAVAAAIDQVLADLADKAHALSKDRYFYVGDSSSHYRIHGNYELVGPPQLYPAGTGSVLISAFARVVFTGRAEFIESLAEYL